jgi:adenosylmethionine-8-amino-7-oxononanoate aminotransferase
MITGGYLTLGATLTTKKVYDSFLGSFDEQKHLFHGHTYTGNPIATTVALENLKLYKKNNLIKKIQNTSKVFTEHYDTLQSLNMVGDIRHKGMLMGIELVQNKKTKTPIHSKNGISINKIFYDIGSKNGIYLRTLGNILMLVPPLDISESNLDTLIQKAIKTISSATRHFI